jgi:chromosome partitioning protein
VAENWRFTRSAKGLKSPVLRIDRLASRRIDRRESFINAAAVYFDSRPGVGRVICIANQKGGVGKTTTAVNLAVALARGGAETLLVDLDPQCNATTGIGANPLERHPLAVDRSLRESIQPTDQQRLSLLPGSRSHLDVAALTADAANADRLASRLRSGTTAYDFVLIDCPPSMGVLTESALAVAREVMMPIQCEYFAMEGLADMIRMIGRVIDERSGDLQFGGIVLTMYDERLELTAEVDREVREFFGEIVYQTVIPRDVAVCEAPSHGKSVLDYAPRSRGSRAYAELCMEILKQ